MVELPDEVKNMQTSDSGSQSAPASRPAPSGGERGGDRSGGDRSGGGDRGGPRSGGDRGRGGGGGGRGGDRGRGGRRPQRRRGRLFGGGKVCYFCVNKVKHIDYKDLDTQRRFLTPQAKIQPRRLSGVCAKHQRMLTSAVKRSRLLALLPFTPTY